MNDDRSNEFIRIENRPRELVHGIDIKRMNSLLRLHLVDIQTRTGKSLLVNDIDSERLFSVVVFLISVLAIAPSLGADPDWLISPLPCPATMTVHENELTLGNGLITRTFRIEPNFATVSINNPLTGASLLRGVKPEAVVRFDGQDYEVGGLKGQPDYGYLDTAWIDSLTANPEAFAFKSYSVSKPEAPFSWTPKRHAPKTPWPPRGVTLHVDFTPPAKLAEQYPGLSVTLTYEVYDNLPVIAKWITVRNGSKKPLVIESLSCEILAVNEYEKPRLHVESNYAFAGMNTTEWGPDAEYLTQVDYNRQSPVLMTSRYPLGPGVRLKPGGSFSSFKTCTLWHDSDDRERQRLARRRMYRTLAPQATENPILMHVRESTSEAIRTAIDQCAEVGFEMVIITFWSGFNIESDDLAYIARLKADTDYAHSKGIELGGYTLMCASRDEGPENNCISPETGKPGSKFGQSACLASEWSDGYFKRVLHFLDETGMDVIETDGPFHGDVCAATNHAHHHGLADSQLAQWSRCVDFYHECRKRGIYINTPDWYYLNGSNKCAMGYREDNFSLPRAQQIIHSRQNIFDGTFDKTPSMGWMFVPLVEYQGGGAAATLEPLSEHLHEYEWHLAQCFASGVQACYRGPRLFDTDETKAVVRKWVDFYKAHRNILDSDIIHVRRADGQEVDCMLHVNPQLPECGLAFVSNPSDQTVETELVLPLYYTGLERQARIKREDGEARVYDLDREYRVTVPLQMEPKSMTWLVVEKP